MIFNPFRFLFICSLALFFSACAQQATFQPGTMDDTHILDPSLNDPTYKVSERTHLDPTKPVIIAVHGYTASTYEWQEFLNYADGRATHPIHDVYVSLVLLGGHGRSLSTFRDTT